jgi:phosphatidylglycerol:prolipoprotein diacylglycerol transferase
LLLGFIAIVYFSKAWNERKPSLFPYIETEGWRFGAFAVAPFGSLVAIGLAVGYLVASWRAQLNGIGRESFAKLSLWVIAAAFLGGHLAKFAYVPDGWRLVLTHPSVLLNIFQGQASFGSFIGGYLASLAFMLWNRVPYRDWFLYADAGCFAVPFGWWFGRAGCYLLHDHPGIRTSSFLGVQYPGGARYDLGLLEALFLLALAALFLFLDRKPRPRGFYYVAFLLCYGPFRFWLDTLHVDPPRYGGWTVDQIASSLMIAGAVVIILDLIRLERTRTPLITSPEAYDRKISAVPQEQ